MSRFFVASSVILLIFCLFVCNAIRIVTAVDANCYYTDYLIPEEIYPIEYIDYPANIDCLWQFQSDQGTTIELTCNVDIQYSRNCDKDKLLVYLSEGSQYYYTDVRNYCGTGTFSVVSNGNLMALELQTEYISNGGSIKCQVKAVPVTQCDCGWKKATRIVNGDPTLVNEYPAMAGLRNAVTQETVCGCTILTRKYVLTAAHCIPNIPLQHMEIVVGDWDTSTTTDTTATAVYKAYSYQIAPGYDFETQINDLAVIKIADEIVFSLYVGPMCLPFSYSDNTFEDHSVTILGWGQIFFNGPVSDSLQKAEVEVTNNTYCQEMYPNNDITENHICTYSSSKDACQQDSGGPLIWQNPTTGRLYVIGVISYGYGCANNYPGVNTRVTKYLSWIVSQISDSNICVK